MTTTRPQGTQDEPSAAEATLPLPEAPGASTGQAAPSVPVLGGSRIVSMDIHHADVAVVHADVVEPFPDYVPSPCKRCGRPRSESKRWLGADGICGDCLAPDLWPSLIAQVEAAMQPGPTMDIRQHATARALKARTLEMLRTRAAEAGPVRAVASTQAIDGALDALLGLYAVALQAPAKVRPLMDGIVQAQLQVVLGLAGVSRSVPGGEG